MINAALVIAGAIFIHAGWTTHPIEGDDDVAVPVLLGVILIAVGLTSAWLG